MATWLKQSTAIEIKLGPFVDQADGFTAETTLTISQADVRLAKNDGDWAQKAETTAMVHEENGWYRCLLDTTDTNTLGILIVAVNEAGALPVWREFLVVPANVWDSYLGADLLQVHAAEISNDLITAASIAAGAITSSEAPNLDAAISTRATPAQVNTEVLDVLNTDTFAEPGQGSPAATTTLVAKIGHLYKAWRNRHTQTANEYALYADDGTTKDQEAAVSDDGTTFDRGEVVTGA